MIPIPNYISEQLRQHILDQCPSAEAGWEFANQDEDTLTGDFFGRMRTEYQENGAYKWRFQYNKVRGRGKGALEKTIGADGIITLHFRDQITGNDYYKSIVFQAKKENNRIDNVQWDKMKSFFPNGNMIVSYGANGYSSFIDTVSNKESLCHVLSTNFLNCTIGIEGLHYDSLNNKFIRPSNFPMPGRVKHELMIEVFENP
jgi:hypothetical protein